MFNDREVSALRSTLETGLRGHKVAPSDRARVVLVTLAGMLARARAAATVSREQADRARAIAARFDAAAQAHEADAEKIRSLATQVKREGLPQVLARYSPPGWLDLAG
jgi:hypothetical protein